MHEAKSGKPQGTAGKAPAGNGLADGLAARTRDTLTSLARAYDWYSEHRTQMKPWEREAYLAGLCLATTENHVALLRAFVAEHVKPRLDGDLGGPDGAESQLAYWDAETVLRGLWLMYAPEAKALGEKRSLEIWGGWPIAEPVHFINRVFTALHAGPAAHDAERFRLYLAALYEAYAADPMPIPNPDFR